MSASSDRGGSPPADLRFRPPGPGDAAVLEDMVLALYEEDPPGETMSREKVRATVRELERNPAKGRITVFVAEGSVVGYAIVLALWSNEHGGDVGMVDEMYVKPTWRSRGIASAFLDHLAGPDAPPLKALLLEVTPANDRAMALYRRKGFRPDPNRYLFREVHREDG